MKPTIEQQQIIDAASLGDTILISAFAGSGKTTTLVMLAQTLAPARGLYLAYNKAMQLEASAKFPKNVQCLTIHSLAFRHIGYKYKKQLQTKITTNLIDNYYRVRSFKDNHEQYKFFVHKANIAAHAKAVVSNLCISEDSEISFKHRSYRHISMLEKEHEHLPEKVFTIFLNKYMDVVLGLAGRLWDDMRDTENDLIPMDHEGYLKCYQLSHPQLKQYDFIMLDEAQDANPPIIKILQEQGHVQRFYVGDPYQQIYAWRGSINAMEQLEGSPLYLTQSFRFGQAIAEQANHILKKLDCEKEIIGNPLVKSIFGKIDSQNPYTIIGRTNAGLFNAILDHEDQNRSMAWVGNLDEVLLPYKKETNKNLIFIPNSKVFWLDIKNIQPLDDRLIYF